MFECSIEMKTLQPEKKKNHNVHKKYSSDQTDPSTWEKKIIMIINSTQVKIHKMNFWSDWPFNQPINKWSMSSILNQCKKKKKTMIYIYKYAYVYKINIQRYAWKWYINLFFRNNLKQIYKYKYRAFSSICWRNNLFCKYIMTTFYIILIAQIQDKFYCL